MMEIQLIQNKYDTVGFEQGRMMLRFFDAKQDFVGQCRSTMFIAQCREGCVADP